MAKVIFNQLMEENGLVAQTNKLSHRKCCKVLLPPNLDKCHFSLFHLSQLTRVSIFPPRYDSLYIKQPNKTGAQ